VFVHAAGKQGIMYNADITLWGARLQVKIVLAMKIFGLKGQEKP
jgi:hypothetical protein